MIKNLRYIFVPFLFCYSIFSHDFLLEFKTAAFFPTNSCVRKIYGRAGALYGPELTFKFCENRNWYGFASVDFLSKKGRSLGLCNRTKMHIVPLAVGAKYFVPHCYGDFYLGFGFQALKLKTLNCSPFVVRNTSKWGFGGIAKIGSYFDLPSNLFLDIFVDYSFARINCDKCLKPGVIPLKVKMDGVIFGIGIGYRFNC